MKRTDFLALPNDPVPHTTSKGRYENNAWCELEIIRECSRGVGDWVYRFVAEHLALIIRSVR